MPEETEKAEFTEFLPPREDVGPTEQDNILIHMGNTCFKVPQGSDQSTSTCVLHLEYVKNYLSALLTEVFLDYPDQITASYFGDERAEMNGENS